MSKIECLFYTLGKHEFVPRRIEETQILSNSEEPNTIIKKYYECMFCGKKKEQPEIIKANYHFREENKNDRQSIIK